jgi:hypothetical protein
MSTQNSERPSLQKLGLAILLATVMVASSFLAAAPPLLQQQAKATAPPNPGTIIPYYSTDTSDPEWNTLIALHNNHTSITMFVIVNPSNGPGAGKSSAWDSLIYNLHSAGIKVLGYTHTHYETIPYRNSGYGIEDQIDDWNNWYNSGTHKGDIDGIFLDEMQNQFCSNPYCSTSYYSGLTSYVHSLGITYTVGNPGGPSDSNWASTVDLVQVYERAGAPDAGTVASNEDSISHNQAGIFPYCVSASQVTQSYINTLAQYVNFIYFTDQGGSCSSNAWYPISSYLGSLLDMLVKTYGSPSTGGYKYVNVNVNSADTSNKGVNGMYVQVLNGSNSAFITGGYTNTTFNLIASTSYQLNASDYGNLVFDHWNTGSTNRVLPITTPSSGSATYTVYYHYKCTTCNNPTLTVYSKFTNGTSITGLWTELKNSSGVTIDSGYTTKIYTSIQAGKVYQIGASDWKQYIFDHWSNDTSQNRWHTFNITSPSVITAYYRTPTFSETVNSAFTNGTTLNGMWMVLRDDQGNIVQSGWTPITFTNLISGNSYTITASNYKQNVFDHWDDGTTNAQTWIPRQGGYTVTAYYRVVSSSASIYIDSAWANNGGPITGMYMQLTDLNNNILQTGYTPITFSGLTTGTQYYVYANSYGTANFDHWNDGTTTSNIKFTANGYQAYTALYHQTSSNITVTSVDMFDQPITGMYMQLTDLHNNVLQTGWTQVTFTNVGYGTYYIYANDYCNSQHQDMLFDHWSDGTTTRNITITPLTNMYLTAVYRITTC